MARLSNCWLPSAAPADGNALLSAPHFVQVFLATFRGHQVAVKRVSKGNEDEALWPVADVPAKFCTISIATLECAQYDIFLIIFKRSSIPIHHLQYKPPLS